MARYNPLKIEQSVPELYPRLVQYVNGKFYDGNGNLIITGGSAGPVGATGSVGPVGMTGTQGIQGVTGTGGVVALYYSGYDTTTQTNLGATFANAMRINTTAESNGIFVTQSSRVVITSSGTYNIQFSAQIDKTDSGNDEIEIWLSKNGVNVIDSGGIIELSGNNAENIAVWNYVMTFAANDYFELYWHSVDVNLRILSRGIQSNPARPAVPSLILTVTQVTYTQLGPTGSAGATGATGPGGGTNYFLQNTLPVNPSIGDRWYNTSTGVESVYIYDGFGFLWISPASSGPQGPTGPVGATGPQGSTGATGSDASLPTLYAPDTQHFLQSNTTVIQTISAGVNFLRGYYITIDKTISFDELFISISVTTAGNSINGIYSILSNGYPDALLYTTTIFDNSILNKQSSIQNGTLVAGNYLVAQNSSSAAVFRCHQAQLMTNTSNFFGVTDGANIHTGLGVAYTYNGTLPATFPVGATKTTGALPYLLFNVV